MLSYDAAMYRQNLLPCVLDHVHFIGERITQKMLNRYLGGTAELYFHSTQDSLSVKIDEIEMIAGAIEVRSDCVYRRKYRGRKWRPEEKYDGILSVTFGRGCRSLDGPGNAAGTLLIMGAESDMILRPPRG